MAEESQGPMPDVAVAIHSDNRLFQESLSRALLPDARPVLELVPADCGEARIVVLDAAAEGALARCSQLARSGRGVVVVNLESETGAVSALRAGARGVLERRSGIDELLSAIGSVAEGRVWAPQGVVALALSLQAALTGQAAEESKADRMLTRREKEILGHTVGGLSNKEIADRMAIRTSTVKAHLTSVFRKLSVRDRTQLVVLYHHAGPGRVPAAPAGRGSFLA